MIVPTSKGVALGLALFSMVCWGSWSNSMKMLGDRMSFECFYINYGFAIFITAIIGAFALGTQKTSDDGPGAKSFLDDFSNAAPINFFLAFLVGVDFNLANLALCKGIDMMGLALAFPLVIGTALIGGAVLSYLTEPLTDSTSTALFFGGVGIAFVSVCLTAYLNHVRDQQLNVNAHDNDTTNLNSDEKHEPSQARKLTVCIVGGILMSLWGPLLNIAMKGDDGVTPFTGFIFYTGAVVVSNFVLIPAIILYPLEGGPGKVVGEVLSGYRKAPAAAHMWTLIGGFVWACGTLSNTVAGAQADLLTYAQSYATGQCAAAVSILWGLLVWSEFAGTDGKVKGLIVLILLLFTGAVFLIASAG